MHKIDSSFCPNEDATCARYGHDGVDLFQTLPRSSPANVAESTMETFLVHDHILHKMERWLKSVFITSFLESEYTWFSRCSWHMKRPNLCDILNLGRVGLRLLIGRWARASSKQTFVGWSTAESYLPILVLKYEFSSIAEIHGLNHWLAHNRAYGYFGFIDIKGKCGTR